jgi:hypothetical protein
MRYENNQSPVISPNLTEVDPSRDCLSMSRVIGRDRLTAATFFAERSVVHFPLVLCVNRGELGLRGAYNIGSPPLILGPQGFLPLAAPVERGQTVLQFTDVPPWVFVGSGITDVNPRLWVARSSI